MKWNLIHMQHLITCISSTNMYNYIIDIRKYELNKTYYQNHQTQTTKANSQVQTTLLNLRSYKRLSPTAQILMSNPWTSTQEAQSLSPNPKKPMNPNTITNPMARGQNKNPNPNQPNSSVLEFWTNRKRCCGVLEGRQIRKDGARTTTV